MKKTIYLLIISLICSINVQAQKFAYIDSDYILNKIPQTFKENNPQVLYLGKNETTKNYKYELEIYYGGLNSDKITAIQE